MEMRQFYLGDTKLKHERCDELLANRGSESN